MIEDISLRLSPASASSAALKKIISEKKGLKPEEINDYKILRRSIDARQKQVKVNLTIRIAYGEDKTVMPHFFPVIFPEVKEDAPQIIIVGAGPAGLFAGLKAIELGLKPIILERGKDVDRRRIDVADISRKGIVSPDSNYCFGEGGAGAFSDGKLFTRSKKRGNINSILQLLYQHGAKEDILIDSHPHIGSDKLPGVIKNIRKTIIENGGVVKFDTKVTSILIENCQAVGVEISSGEIIKGPVVLASGHSAREIYKNLKDQGVEMEAKSIAMGVRLEHPQHLIDQLQYHQKEGRGAYLPAAEYSFVTQVEGRGVYSFCMCPGGVVVPSMSAPGESLVNGMSASSRSSQWANSGMVVEIHPGDIPGFDSEGALEILSLQEHLENKFYSASNNSYNAPAQLMTDFVKGKETRILPKTSYPAGIHSARLDELLPPQISNRLKEGFKIFDKKCKGFLSDKAVMIGLESRTSSPVRIPRDKDTMEHITIKNLYPAGEGAGYAGGIVSSAIDGQRVVEAYYNKITKQNGNNN